jgi:glycerol uptake facilitator protein
LDILRNIERLLDSSTLTLPFMTPSPFLGELMGTLVLILLGNGVVANVVLQKTKGNNSGWIVITAGWAFAVTMGVFVSNAFGSADAHLNPAVTLGMAIANDDYGKLFSYISAQMIGAILGATFVWLHHLPHWEKTQDKGAKLAAFATDPAIRANVPNVISEVIGTVILLVGIKGIGAVSTGLGPFAVGILVWAIGLSLGGTTGYCINPARDLGPRIAHALLPIAGKGDSDWKYAWIPVVGPMLGAILAGLLLL